MNIINRLSLPENPVVKINDEDEEEPVVIFFDKPEKMDNLPEIDNSLINEKFVKIMSADDIVNYYNYFIKGDLRIYVFNGARVIDYEFGGCYCDYCRTEVDTSNYYYCYHCYSDMCNYCYEETSEEIAIKNGAKNYASRAKVLNKCRSCDLIKPRNIDCDNKVCDSCREVVDKLIGYYSVKQENIDDTHDICLKCYDEDTKYLWENVENYIEDLQNNIKIHIKDEDIKSTKEMVEKRGMKFYKYESEREKYPFYYTDFGSMLNWIPIITDNLGKNCTDYGNIFINLNPDDKNYKKICLQSCDDHARCGYFILYDEEHTLDNILKMLKEICDENKVIRINCLGEEEEEELNCSHHSSPIQVLMRKLGVPVYYG